jgi:hypothetical protein
LSTHSDTPRRTPLDLIFRLRRKTLRIIFLQTAAKSHHMMHDAKGIQTKIYDGGKIPWCKIYGAGEIHGVGNQIPRDKSGDGEKKPESVSQAIGFAGIKNGWKMFEHRSGVTWSFVTSRDVTGKPRGSRDLRDSAMGERRGVSKREKVGRRLPTLQVAHPKNGHKAVSAVVARRS